MADHRTFVPDNHNIGHPSTQKVRTIVITPPDGGGPPFLIVEIDVDCEVCGGFTAEIAGHHVKGLAEELAIVVEANPDLVGEGLDHGKRERREWEGMIPGAGKARTH